MTQSDFLTPSGGAAELGPRRTPDPVEAWGLVQVDGAVILTGAGATAEAAMAAARTVFAGRALAIPEAAEVRAGGVMDQVVNRPSPEEALGVHTDGFGYGDFYPDGVTTSNYIWSYGTATPGVYQQLSTRNGGEVLSADQY